ncbi:MAG: prolyl oligopeptidase family serine peptidase [Opitutaceae bacterium]|nr:prolyl oligopeptidase family serine peptidase [Opitutaceae bacterium]
MRRLLAVFLLAAAVAPMRAATLEAYQAIHAPLECETAAISPDGKSLAAIVRTEGKLELRIFDLDTAKAIASVRFDPKLTKFPGEDRLLWVGATRLVAQIGWREIVAIDADGKNQMRLVDWEQRHWFRAPLFNSGPERPCWVKVVAWSADEPEFVHIEAASLGSFAVVRVHHGTGRGEVRLEELGDPPVLYDRRGVARVRTRNRDNPEGYDLRVLNGKAGPWRPLDRVLASEDQPQFRVTVGNVHGPRSLPLGFGRDPEVLYYASNVGRDTFGIYAVDLRTKQRTEFALEHPTIDLAPVFLPWTGEAVLVRERTSGEVVGARFATQPTGAVWAEADLRSVQENLGRLAPDHGVRIENWDDARERFLVRLSHRAEPGGFAVFTRADGKLSHLFDRAPRLSGFTPPHTTPWVITRPDGSRLTGHLTLPASMGGEPLPVVVVMRPEAWVEGVSADYSPVARSLAHMGYAVIEIAHRGTLGLGLRHWEAGRGRLAEVTAEDVFTAVDRIASVARLERGKVALVGTGFGATMALKLAVLSPERVVCVVAEGPLVDMHGRVRDGRDGYEFMARRREVDRAYFGPSKEQLRAWSPEVFAAKLTRPVMIVTTRQDDSPFLDDPTPGFIKRLRATKFAPEVLRVKAVNGRPDMLARISAATEKFLAEHLPLPPR